MGIFNLLVGQDNTQFNQLFHLPVSLARCLRSMKNMQILRGKDDSRYTPSGVTTTLGAMESCWTLVQQKAAEHFGHYDTCVQYFIIYANILRFQGVLSDSTEKSNFFFYSEAAKDTYFDCKHLISFLNIFHIIFRNRKCLSQKT